MFVIKSNENFFVCVPLGRWPNERITTPSSAIVIVPSSSLSNSINASLNSGKGNEKNVKFFTFFVFRPKYFADMHGNKVFLSFSTAACD